ncbi:MAG: hypothetical protein QW171_03205 [Candidatus Bilamarchaeaceae archaeon]
MKIAIPTLLDVSGLHVGQVLSLKNAAGIARMTKKSLLIPYKKASDYPLVETIKKTLTENECRYVEILDVENERHFAKEIKRLVILSFKKHGKIMNLTPPQQDSIRINLIFGKQFESDLEYSMGAVQKLNIVSEKKQTIFEIEKGQYITQEFINAALPCVFTGIDTFVLGGNVIGAWPTKAIKLTNSEGKPLNHYNIFLEDLVKEHLRKKIGVLAPELSRAYLIEGLFEAYLFEKILWEEIKCVAEEMVLPTDLVKKSLGLQRTIDYLRWHLITAHGKDLFNENEIFSLYKFFLEQRRRLTKKMRKAEFFEILGKRSTVLERLHELSKNFNTAEIRSYLLLLSKTMDSDSNPSEKDFAVFCKTINSDLQLSELDEMSTKILGIKFSEDIAQSIRMFLELKCSKHPKTQFLEKEAIKALLQRLRLHSLFAKNDEIYETLPAEVVEYLYDIDPVYAAAALKKILSESIKDNLLVFYWNNLTHISDLYKKGLPCK